jgi:hypothetical protein
MKAEAAVAALPGPVKRKAADAATAPKKTKVNKPGPQTDHRTLPVKGWSWHNESPPDLWGSSHFMNCAKQPNTKITTFIYNKEMH